MRVHQFTNAFDAYAGLSIHLNDQRLNIQCKIYFFSYYFELSFLYCVIVSLPLIHTYAHTTLYLFIFICFECCKMHSFNFLLTQIRFICRIDMFEWCTEFSSPVLLQNNIKITWTKIAFDGKIFFFFFFCHFAH